MGAWTSETLCEIWRYTFCWKEKNIFSCSTRNKLIVIPVNSHFDTIVEDPTVPNPLVSVKTIHGKWLKLYEAEKNMSPAEIQNAIYEFLDAKVFNIKLTVTNEEVKENIRQEHVL